MKQCKPHPGHRMELDVVCTPEPSWSVETDAVAGCVCIFFLFPGEEVAVCGFEPGA